MTHSTLTRGCVLLALAAPMLTADISSAQSGQRGTMIIGNDQGRHVLHFTEPDLDLVLQPDLRPSDVRIFDRELTLSDAQREVCLLYTSPSPRDRTRSRMPSSA